MEELKKTITQLAFWDELSEDEKAYAEQNTCIQSHKKGSLLHSCGNECLGMISVISGEIRVYLLSEEGREITLFNMYPGDVGVMSASCVISEITFETHMEVGRDCKIMVMSSMAFSNLAENNVYVRCFMYKTATKSFSDVMWTMQQIMFFKFDRRLASFLVSECERSGSQEINMTHEHIAHCVSSAREVVARMMKRFSEEGLVELKRGKVIITDIEGLKKII